MSRQSSQFPLLLSMSRTAPLHRPTHPIVLVVVMVLGWIYSSAPLVTAFPLHSTTAVASQWNVSACHVTFADIDTPSAFPFLNYRTLSFSCPPSCNAPSSPISPPVYGSYPYSPLSSICLSAVHCGLLNDSLGGSVLVSRFYRHDWSNSSTQTIFPFNSSLGSLSNGVNASAVPSGSYSVPSNATSWSYVVRGRGELVTQRRSAPFPPRYGHLHISFPPSYNSPLPDRPPPACKSVHVIIGGYNGQSYLNDLWIAEPSVWEEPNSDIEWKRLSDAPFSPRSDMQQAMTGFRVTNRFYIYSVFIWGGQTGHECGLYELGVCSGEVWQLLLNVSYPSGIFVPTRFVVESYLWSSLAPVGLLPFPSRCGATAVFLSSSGRATLLVGGQLSYSDPTCQASPTTVSEVWVNYNVNNYSRWTRDEDAPFSPRRSQQRESVLAVADEAVAPLF